MNRRVVVTGTGVITPVGNDVQTYWKNLLDAVCGIDVITSIPTDDLPVKIAGEVKDFNPADYEIEAPFARKQDKFTIYAVAAAWQAVKQSGLSSAEDGNIDPLRFGVYVGSGIGGFSTQMRETEKILNEGAKWVSPLFIPTMISNIAAGNIAIRNNACGPCLPVSTACSTSTHAVGEAYRAIKHGYADAIIAGGTGLYMDSFDYIKDDGSAMQRGFSNVWEPSLFIKQLIFDLSSAHLFRKPRRLLPSVAT